MPDRATLTTDPSPRTATNAAGSPLPAPFEYARRPVAQTFTVGTTGDGYAVAAARQLSTRNMSASGPITVAKRAGVFHYLRVNSIRSGTPTINVRNGGPTGTIVRTVSAAAGATIDQTGSPDACAAGIFLEVVGAARGLDITVRYV